MKNFSPKIAKSAFTLVEIMITVVIIGILLAIAIPNFIKAREQSRAKSCSANLSQIDLAKQQYAMDNNLYSNSSVVPSSTDLVGPSSYIRVAPSCPSTNNPSDYTYGAINTAPTCANNNVAQKYFHTAVGN